MLHSFFQILSGFELHDAPCRNHHLVARFGVSTNPRRARRSIKTAEITNLDTPTFDGGIGYRAKDQAKGCIDIILVRVRKPVSKTCGKR